MKKKVGIVSLLLVILLLFPVVGYKVNNTYQGNITNAQNISTENELRGVWIATVNNINFPSKPGLTAEQQMKELDAMVENAEYMGFNNIFFQVRPTGDALYKSSVFPWSAYLTGKQGKANDKDFDPLSYIIQQAHKKNIKVHAWLNPLRLTYDAVSETKGIQALSTNNPARKIPEAVVRAGNGQLYLNPGYPEAIKLIEDGVAEIVKNYDVDGIHFDDYFYPSKGEAKGKDFDDAKAFEKYKGSFSNKEDWRRNNIDTLVKSIYQSVKEIKPQVEFGISPFAIWSNKSLNNEGSDTEGGISTYYDHYADTKKWVKQQYLDYIAPQIYWNIGFKVADYSKLLDWWANVCNGTNVKLYVGHAAYKINDTTQANEWMDPLQIPKQIAMNRNSKAVSGSIFYGYSTLCNNTLGIKEKLRGIYVSGRNPGSTVPEDRQLVIAAPANGFKTSYSKVSILGSCDPDQPVLVNGKSVQVSQDGYFTLYQELAVGDNNIVFSHKGKQTTLKIIRKATTQSTPYKMNSPQFKPGSFAPTESMTMKTGQTIDLSCAAPTGAKVWVEIGGYKVDLINRGELNSNGGSITPASYSGTFIFPTVSGTQRVLSLGNPVYVMEYNGQRITSKQSYTLSVQSNKYYKYAVISTSAAEAVARTGPSGDYSRMTPLMNGAADYIVGQRNGYYLLRSGVWTDGSNLKVVNDKALATNKVSSVSMKDNGSYTDITFKMPVNAVFSVDVTNSAVTLNLYNTTGQIVNSAIPSGAIFKSVTCNTVGGNAQFTFNLKNIDNYFGYNALYKNGTLVFSLKKSPSISGSGSKPLSGLRVLIDAGHGGTESGAIGPLGKYGPYEKQFNLSIALNTRKYLNSLGATVIMTRTSDKTVSLNDRANLIRKEKPDIAVSIHNNSMDVTANYANYSGLLVLYSKDSSRATAGFVKNSLISQLQRKDDGFRWQSLSVCTVTQSPAILIEGGFMSNPEEYQWLSRYENQVKLANAIGKSIETWAYKYKAN